MTPPPGSRRAVWGQLLRAWGRGLVLAGHGDAARWAASCGAGGASRRARVQPPPWAAERRGAATQEAAGSRPQAASCTGAPARASASAAESGRPLPPHGAQIGEVSSKRFLLDVAAYSAFVGFFDIISHEFLPYAKYHDLHGGDEEFRKSNYTDLVNKYYDLVTRFTEYHWGQSFHFAPRWHEETLRESIKRFEHFIALQLGLKKGMKVLDVGCGIGGPLRELARFSSTEITGLNNNAYQISRGKELISSAGLSEQCNLIKGDFMNMPFPDNTFDAAYAIEATIHAPDALGAYKEIYRVLKPGQHFALDEICLTDKFDPNNAGHRKIKAEIELGCGLPDIRSTHQCIQAMKDAGFEIVFAKDLAEDSPCPWYQEIDPGHITLASFSNSHVGHFITHAIVGTLEFLRIAPKGCNRLFSILQTANHGLVTGSREEILTVTFFVLGRKPLKESEF